MVLLAALKTLWFGFGFGVACGVKTVPSWRLGKALGQGSTKNPEGGHLLGAIGHTGVPGVSRASILTQHLRKCAGKIFTILSRWSTAASQTDVLLFVFFVGSISVFPFRFLSKSHTHTHGVLYRRKGSNSPVTQPKTEETLFVHQLLRIATV